MADLKEKDHKNPGKVDQGAMRDKEEKLRVAEKKFTEMNDDLMVCAPCGPLRPSDFPKRSPAGIGGDGPNQRAEARAAGA